MPSQHLGSYPVFRFVMLAIALCYGISDVYAGEPIAASVLPVVVVQPHDGWATILDVSAKGTMAGIIVTGTLIGRVLPSRSKGARAAAYLKITLVDASGAMRASKEILCTSQELHRNVNTQTKFKVSFHLWTGIGDSLVVTLTPNDSSGG